MAWHKHNYWLGDIKPDNLVYDQPSQYKGSTAPLIQVYVIDLESAVRHP